MYGDNKPYLVALLVLNDEFVNITNEEINNAINNLNNNFSKIENIKKFFLIKEKFSIENGMLTPCLLYTSPSPRDKTVSRMPSSA